MEDVSDPAHPRGHIGLIETALASSKPSLTVIGKGMGIHYLAHYTISAYASSNDNLCFALNAPKAFFTPTHITNTFPHAKVHFINSDVPATVRQQHYLQGGYFPITNRILSVDLLNMIIPIAKITGIIVFDAHKVVEGSSEAFILRLFRQHNHTGFIKAFSDRPDVLVSGFSKIEHTMKALFVTELNLWPRFRASVQSFLEKRSVDVVELYEPLTDKMQEIQDCILSVIEACLNELKRCEANNLHLDHLLNDPLDETQHGSDAGQHSNMRASSLFRNLDFIVRRQLDGVWNEIGSKTKTLIGDLTLLRKLLQYLLSYDCISFYEFLNSIRDSPRSHKSLWLYTESASQLFSLSKNRIYRVVAHKSDQPPIAKRPKLEVGVSGLCEIDLVLEPNPKWLLLTEILDEIDKDERSDASKAQKENVLIVCTDGLHASQIKAIICDGADSLLQSLWLKYLKRLRVDQKLSSIETGNSRHFNDSSVSPEAVQVKSQLRREYELLSSALKNLEDGRNEDTKVSRQNKRTKPEFKFVDMCKSKLRIQPQGLQVSVVSLDSIDGFSALELYSPKYVILYDMDLEFMRLLELYRSFSPGKALRTYCCMFEASFEEERFLQSVNKENEAFEKLIHEKSVMLINITQMPSLSKSGPRGDEVPHGNALTRHGGNLQQKKIRKVIVDVREFRSSLPGFIHLRGLHVIPVTLEVGDYVLSPTICVERKSIGDLFSSLNSGRLFTQLTSGCRFYSLPILLIEFDPDKSFCLQDQRAIGEDISNTNIISKLCLVMIHFPNVKFIWSRGPHFTAEIFESLKELELEPDEKIAAAVGVEVAEQALQLNENAEDERPSGGFFEEETDEDDGLFMDSHLSRDLLRKLPGINANTFLSVLNLQSGLPNLQCLLNSDNDILDQKIGAANSRLLRGFASAEISFDS
jgi:DNA excision repair protein ERCC-4